MPQAPRFEFHHDFAVLEERLAGLLLGLKESAGPLAPAAVVVPTNRLAAQLQTVLAARLPALLNVRFLNHDSLARAIAASAGVTLPRVAGDAVRAALLGAAVEAIGGDLAAYARSRPGSLSTLLRTMDDLREAGVEPGSSDDRAVSSRGRETLQAYERYARDLDRLAAAGFSDRAGRTAAARRHAAAYGGRFRLVVHYGAYELIGANLDLMEALASSGVPIVYLAPGHTTAPAFAYARRFWPRLAGAAPLEAAGGAPAVATRLLADRLPLLYDEEATAASPRPVEFFHAQGEEAELGEAALRVAGLLKTGVPLDRMALVARTLEPYAAHLETVLGEHGLPFEATAALGAAREPAAQAVLRLVRSIVDDYPSGPLFDLFRCGLYVDGVSDPASQTDAWERLAREGRFAGGVDAWTRRLPAWIEAREPWVPPDADTTARQAAEEARRSEVLQAQALASCVGRLATDAVPLSKARRWGAWADALRVLLGSRLRGFIPAPAAGSDARAADTVAEDSTEAPGGVATVLEALADMSLLDATRVPCSPETAAQFLERAVGAGRVPIGSVGADGARRRGDQGGLRVLDAVQARGLSFDALFLLGLNVDLFPRRPREDPFLPDEDRRRLRDRLRRPVPVAGETLDEEHLLLAHLLGAPRAALTVSWQRADDSGKARVPSLALREVARVALGAAEIEAAERRAVRISAHPADRGRDAIGRLGLLAPRAAGLLAALELRSPAALDEALRPSPGGLMIGPVALPAGSELLPAAVTRMAAVEEGSAAPGRWDALPGAEAGPPPATWSPSRLELLGSCPQQFFFRRILGIEEWGEAAEPHEVEARDVGSQVHAVLQEVYAALLAGKDLPAPADAGGAIADRAREHLARAWRARTSRTSAPVRGAYPRLWDLISEQWLAALERFILRDLTGMAASPPSALLLEHVIEAALPLGSFGAPLPVRGRLDRLARQGDGTVVVADYKTSGPIADHVSILDALKGTRLQMALYALLAESETGASGRRPSVRAEVLGVGPTYEGAADDAWRATVDPEKFARARDGLLETLAVLRDLAERGFYPLNEDSRLCRFCPFTRACRRDHAPTLERLARSADLDAWRGVRRKSTARPTLDKVAAAGATGEESE
ncbi:MAG TPA: PD-(D/E)XK nuclease family protein [Patescibacteria group bacterium]|nr:PD-(D/E)XK nuclease family protein [Patescibacteria group bacterium]